MAGKVEKQNAKRRFTVATLRQVAEKYGATLEGGPAGNWYCYEVEAPAGTKWSASDTHALKVEWRYGEEAYRNEAIADALSRMAYGLHECDDSECDYCHPE